MTESRFMYRPCTPRNIAIQVAIGAWLAAAACSTVPNGRASSNVAVISGRVVDAEGEGVPGVVIADTAGDHSAVTRMGGTFRIALPNGWRGTITPRCWGVVFSPAQCAVGPVGVDGPQDLMFEARRKREAVVRVEDSLPPDSDVATSEDREATSTDDSSASGPTFFVAFGAVDEKPAPDPGGGTPGADFRQYFVSTTGNDAGPGTDQLPFRTIQKAASAAFPGDRIRILSGVYDLRDAGYPANTIHFPRSGEPNRPIVIEGYGATRPNLMTAVSKPIFDFSNTWGHQSAGFGHYIFRNLAISGGRYGWLFRPPAPTWNPLTETLADLLVGQIHDVLIEDCEVDGGGIMESGIYARYAGIRGLTVRRSSFHDTIGTEGTVDIGEWKDAHPAHLVPKSASRNLLFEDCSFYSARHQQSNGIVFQPCTSNVSLRRCRAWNNGKYGFACKGSGGFSLDRCAAWGNDSTQLYCRGFGGDSGAVRPFFPNDFLITNSIFIAPADQRGGGAVNWRQNCDLRMYHCTILGLRDVVHSEAGGFGFVLGNHHDIPSKARVEGCIIAGYTNSPAIRFFASGTTSYLVNTRYEAANNVLYSTASVAFKLQASNFSNATGWKAYWAVGEPGGNDRLQGPSATHADADSLYADPKFVQFTASLAPLRKNWSADLFGPINRLDLHVNGDSPAIGLSDNLSSLNIPELRYDYEGNARPTTLPWTAGALEYVAPK